MNGALPRSFGAVRDDAESRIENVDYLVQDYKKYQISARNGGSHPRTWGLK